MNQFHSVMVIGFHAYGFALASLRLRASSMPFHSDGHGTRVQAWLRHFVSFTLIFLLTAACPTLADDLSDLDEVTQDSLHRWAVPGAAVVAVKADKIVYLKGFGFRNSTKSQPVTPDTLFPIGSITKSFTTTAIAMMVDAGRMRWADHPGKYISGFNLADPLMNRELTMVDLVTHHTSLKNYDLLIHHSPPVPRDELIKRMVHSRPGQPFRTQFQYNNLMYVVAGKAVAQASGTPWESLIGQRILSPLGMNSTNLSVHDSQKTPDFAVPHFRMRPIPFRDIDAVGPAGSINSTARDMAQWLLFQLGDGNFQGNRLVSARRFRELHSPQILIPLEGKKNWQIRFPDEELAAYSMGWCISQYAGHKTISHGGSIDGFKAWMIFIPEKKLGVVTLTNTENNLAPSIAFATLDRLLGRPSRDWNAFFGRKCQKTSEITNLPPPTNSPSRAALPSDTDLTSKVRSACVGAYHHPIYGIIRVAEHNERLFMNWGDLRSRLVHTKNLEFRAFDDVPYQGGPALNGYKKFRFREGRDGRITSLAAFRESFIRK